MVGANGEYFTRPGKDEGVSASIVNAEDGTRLLHVFTSNAPPLGVRSYNAFDLYALLVHNGNAEACGPI